ncbi:unnamed protein product [Urochloa humidicola]
MEGRRARQTGQELCTSSHGTMQEESYRCPHGSLLTAAPTGSSSLQMAHTSPGSDTSTVGSASMDAAGVEQPRRCRSRAPTPRWPAARRRDAAALHYRRNRFGGGLR